MTQIDWEYISKLAKEADNPRMAYLIEIIYAQKEVIAQHEREMRELVSVSPSLVKYAKEITDKLTVAIAEHAAKVH